MKKVVKGNLGKERGRGGRGEGKMWGLGEWGEYWERK